MNLILTKEVLQQNNLTVNEFFYLATLVYGEKETYEESLENLVKKGFVSRVGRPEGFLSEKGADIFNKIMLESAKNKAPEDKIKSIATKMREIFPEGKKEGTSYYWRGSQMEIERKLKSFFINYGDRFSEEEILEATKRYVDSWKKDYRYMQLLKYFIWKDRSSEERMSELLSFLENKDIAKSVELENHCEEDWTNLMI